jgi:hypothetical protein
MLNSYNCLCENWKGLPSRVVNGAHAVWDQKTSKFFVSCGKNPSMKCGYKWSLLKVRKGNYKGEHGGHRWNLEVEWACFSFSSAL